MLVKLRRQIYGKYLIYLAWTVLHLCKFFLLLNVALSGLVLGRIVSR